MRSMFAGISGLKVHQTKMDVIANNIANINTIGFKRSSTTFKESFSQSISGATGASANKGGSNPQQIGMGASIASIVNVMGQGAAQRTDYGSDLMIDGEGFFVVQDKEGFAFTRAGTFEIDAEGNLVDPSGNKVCGWKAIDDPQNPGKQKVVKDRVTPINIYEGTNSYIPAKASSTIDFTGNLNLSTNAKQNNTFSFYDSVGNKYTADVELNYVPAAPPLLAHWTTTIATDVNGMTNVVINGKDKMKMTFDVGVAGTPGTALPPTPVGGPQPPLTGIELNFQDGVLVTNTNATPPVTIPNAVNGMQLSNILLFDEAGNPTTFNSTFGGENGNIDIDFNGLTQFTSKVTATSETKDGNTSGSMGGYSIDRDGIIRGTYSNGQTKILSQIAVADFKNPAGLEKVGGNLYRETINSSEFDSIGSSVSSLGGTMQSGALEMSNVDLSYEFSEMIITQRGFQANSRIITTSDEMIQELVNLKR